MEFRASDVEKIVSVKRTRLQQWLERGWIVPSVRVADGPGTRNVYSRNDLYKIAVFREATERWGLTREMAAKFIQELDFLGPVAPESEVDKVLLIGYIRGKQGAAVKVYKKPFEGISKDVAEAGGFDNFMLIGFMRIKTLVDRNMRQIME